MFGRQGFVARLECKTIFVVVETINEFTGFYLYLFLILKKIDL